MRAFLAIPVGAPALGEVIAMGERLRAELDEVRWAPLQTAHITVHFFGSITPADAGRALAGVSVAMAEQPPLRLHLSGLGCFPSEAAARVLWMGVAGDTIELGETARRCVTAIAGAGFPVERRPYRPHCTLGRPRVPWPGAARGRWRSLAAEQPATSRFVADHLQLYESLTGPDGATHVPRGVIRLPSSS